MDLHAISSDSPVRAAASVVMLRDAPGGLEVFLIKRHGLSDVLGGAHVFPGGKLDPEDSNPALQALLDRSAGELHGALAEPQLDALTAAALHVAALREAFEETGVLYAACAASQAASVWRQMREGRPFHELLAQLSLPLQASQLTPWSRWITPLVGGVIRKRFDTRFFLARLPEGQVARHDNHEATESAWVTPRDALQRYWASEIELAPPQIMSLAHLSRHGSVASALAEARGRKPPLILPESFEDAGTRVVCYPGDERHPVRERALPGPTRLHYRNRRFEPVEGLEALFDALG